LLGHKTGEDEANVGIFFLIKAAEAPKKLKLSTCTIGNNVAELHEDEINNI
jgi:hypothetical protein